MSEARSDPKPTSKRKPKRGRGKPPLVTRAIVSTIAAKIGKGLTVREACLLVGIPYETYESAIKRRPEYALSHERGMAVWLDQALDIVQADLPGSVGHRWLMERRWPERFAKKDLTIINAASSGDLTISAEILNDLAHTARQLYVPGSTGETTKG